jgi:hypothetical protein
MKKSIYSALLLLGTAIASVAVTSISLAQPKEDKPILETKCLLIMVANGRAATLEESFIADSDNTIHRAGTRTFSKDDYQVDVVANDGWMGLTWKKGTRLIGSALTGVANVTGPNRVLILPNPENPGDQVSLTCSLQTRSQMVGVLSVK